MVKLGDFGISKQLEGSKANTVLGTPYYISPEMVKFASMSYIGAFSSFSKQVSDILHNPNFLLKSKGLKYVFNNNIFNYCNFNILILLVIFRAVFHRCSGVTLTLY